MQKGPAPAVQAMLAAAVRQHQAGQLEEAERLYRQVLQAAPRHADALHFRGLLAHQTGRHEAAVDLIDRAIAQNSRVPTFHHNRGIVLAELGKHAPAAASFRRAITLNPQFPDGHFNLGVALHSLGQWDEAAASYARATTLKPAYAEAHANLGLVRSEQGRADEAVAHFERALLLDPNHAAASNGLGNVRRAQGRPDDALACYRRALTQDAAFAEAHDNIGFLLLEQGRPDAALEHFDQALAIRPEHATAHSGRGTALKELGRRDEALTALQRALALAPADAHVRFGLAIAAIPVMVEPDSDAAAALAAADAALDALVAWSTPRPGSLAPAVGRHLPFNLAYLPVDVTRMLSHYGDLIGTAAGARYPQAAAVAKVPRPARDRLRLGIVCAHVRRHPVWDVVLRGLLAHLDQSRIEIVLYHTAAGGDAETDWARNRVARFIQGPQPIESWLASIGQDHPDVLFYPEVGMDTVASTLAALRLAPLQLAGWGHPVTTGLATVDAYVSGELLEPPDATHHYRERLVRLPGTGVCTATPSGAAMPWPNASRTPQTVRFALCQQPIKFDPRDDVLYAQIARAVGPSEFWLAAPDKLGWATTRLRQRLDAAFGAAGLDPSAHLRVMPWLPPDQFLGFLDAMDVYLDCPAFSGYTTAWAALHRGLPIVTHEGGFLRQRLAAGALRQVADVQALEGIVTSREAYTATAVRWADECRHRPQSWSARRAALRAAAVRLDDNRAAVSAFEHELGFRA